MLNTLKKIAISECCNICEKVGYMDTYLFRKNIEKMEIDDISKVANSLMHIFLIKQISDGLGNAVSGTNIKSVPRNKVM